MSESDIFDTSTTHDAAANGFGEPLLLKITARARLYRVARAGKSFIIKTTKDNSGAELSMLKREYELSLGCDHPHIIHVYTYDEQTPVGPGIVMEYIEGRTLAEWLAESPSKEARRRIFGELLAAVGYMHRRGLLHNDLKPENILIARADDSLKIIDFGLSDDDAHYLARTLGCTPRYASPELRERRPLDARSDIYSIGVIMESLWGGGCRRIASKCTRSNREERYADIGQLQRAWDNRRRPLRVAVLLLLAALLLLPTVLYVREQRNRTASELLADENIGRLERLYRSVVDSVERARMDAERAEARRQHLLKTVEQAAERLCRLYADSVAEAHYLQFAYRVLYNYTVDFQHLRERICDTVSDSELKDAAASRMVRLQESTYKRLYETASRYPDYGKVCSEEEIAFYNELIGQGKPFTPYVGDPSHDR